MPNVLHKRFILPFLTQYETFLYFYSVKDREPSKEKKEKSRGTEHVKMKWPEIRPNAKKEPRNL
jgi:hypothetical protein